MKRVIRSGFPLFLPLFLCLVLIGCGASVKAEYQTCQRCKSVREIRTTYKYRYFPSGRTVKILYASPKFSRCSHQWESGVSSGVPTPIPDGLVVLVRSGSSYGAFILKDQKLEPETMTYTWYYRSDGQGKLDPNDPAVETGTGRGSPITFGPFRVHWSTHGEGSGWIYYPNFPGGTIQAGDTHICVTEWRSLENIEDASDPKWVYKASLVDPGS